MQTCMPGHRCGTMGLARAAHRTVCSKEHTPACTQCASMHVFSPLPLHRLPSVTVTYQGLSVETDAAVGAAGIPTVARFLGGDLLAAAQRALAGSDAASRSVRLPVLRDVQGVLKPVRSR